MISLLHNIVFASFNASLFFLLLIFFKRLILRYVGATWYYCLWFVVFVPWVVVWLPFNFSLSNGFHINTMMFYKLLASLIEATILMFDLLNVSFYGWLIGVLVCLFYVCFRHYQYVVLLKNNSQSLTGVEQQLIKQVLDNKKLIPVARIYLSPMVNSPLLCHPIQSRIYLPQDFFQRYSAKEQRYVLHHECIHYQRCDLLANTVAIVLLCLNWFNPLIWFSYRYFRGAQELSCDALLSRQLATRDVKAYGYALLKTAAHEASPATIICPWNASKQLKERCHMLKFHYSKPMKNLLGMLVLALAASFAIAAPSIEKHLIAEDIKISNFSNHKLWMSVNYHRENRIGLVDKNSVSVVTQATLARACRKSPLACSIQFYLTENGDGESVASVFFDLRRGVNGFHSGKNYNISAKDFSVLLYGHGNGG